MAGSVEEEGGVTGVAGKRVAAGWLAAQAGLLSELCAQWLVSLNDRLDELSRGLRLMVRLRERHPALASWCVRVVEAVQSHVELKCGFRIEV